MIKRIWLPLFLLIVCFLTPLVNGTLENLSFDAMLFPWLIGGTASLLLLWEIVKGVRGTREEEAGEEEREQVQQKRKRFIEGLAWVFAILPLIYLLGILIAIPIYLFAFLKWNGEKTLLCLILSACVSAFFYFVFVVTLDIVFYEGILWPYVTG